MQMLVVCIQQRLLAMSKFIILLPQLSFLQVTLVVLAVLTTSKLKQHRLGFVAQTVMTQYL